MNAASSSTIAASARNTLRMRTRSPPRQQRRNAEILGELVEPTQHRRHDRHAVARPLDLALAAALARQSDRVEPRQHLRGLEVAQVAVDLRREGVERHEARDVERHDELARTGTARDVSIEIDDVASERGA